MSKIKELKTITRATFLNEFNKEVIIANPHLTFTKTEINHLDSVYTELLYTFFEDENSLPDQKRLYASFIGHFAIRRNRNLPFSSSPDYKKKFVNSQTIYFVPSRKLKALIKDVN